MTEETTLSQINSGGSLQQQNQKQQNQLESNPRFLTCKSSLIDFSPGAKIPAPVYHTVNEGLIGDPIPKFRSTVEVVGNTYSSLSTFSTRKAAEQDVAKVALEDISRKINSWVLNTMSDEGSPLIYKDMVIWKSILFEYAAKMMLEKPEYNTVNFEGPLPGYVSSINFGGVIYTGEAHKSKKGAEQCAALKVILSIFENFGLPATLFLSTLHKQRFSDVPLAGLESGNSIAATETIKEAPTDRDTNDDVNLDANDVPDAADQQAPDAQSLLVQPNLEMLGCNKKRKPKKKKRADKKLKTEVPLVALESGNSTVGTKTIKEAPAGRDASDDVKLDANGVPDVVDQQAPYAQSLPLQPNLVTLDCNKKRKPKMKAKANKKLKTELSLAGLESGNNITTTETTKEAPADRDTNDDVNLDVNDVPDAADQCARDAQLLPVQPNLEILDCNNKKKKANTKLKTEVPLAGLESGNSFAATETIKEDPADRDINDDVNLDVNDVPDVADQQPLDAQLLPVQLNLEMLDCNKKRKPKEKKKANTKLKTEVPLAGLESRNSTAAWDTNDDVTLDVNDVPDAADQQALDAQLVPVQPNLEMFDCNNKKKKADMKLKTEVTLAGLESGNSTAATETIKEAPSDRETNDDVNLDVNDVPDAADQRAPDAQLLPIQPNLEMLDCHKKRKPKKKKNANTKLKTELPLAGLESGNSTASTETTKEAQDTNDVTLNANDVPDAVDQRALDAQLLPVQPNLGILDFNNKKKKADTKLKTEVPLAGLESGNSITETIKEAPADRDTNDVVNLAVNDVPDAVDQQAPDAQLLPVQPNLEMLDCNKKRKPKKKKRANAELKTEVSLTVLESGNSTAATETTKEAPVDRDTNNDVNFDVNDVLDAADQRALDAQLLPVQPNLEMLDCNNKKKKADTKLKTEVPLAGLESGNSTAATETTREAPADRDTIDDVNVDANDVTDAADQQAPAAKLLPVQPNLEMLDCNEKRKPKKKKKANTKWKTEVPLAGLELGNSIVAIETIKEAPADRDTNDDVNLDANDVPDAATDQRAPDAQLLPVQPNLEMLDCNKNRKPKKKKKANAELKTEVSLTGLESGNSTAATETTKESPADRDTNDDVNLDVNDVLYAADQRALDAQLLPVQPNLEMLDCNNKKKKADTKLKTEVPLAGLESGNSTAAIETTREASADRDTNDDVNVDANDVTYAADQWAPDAKFLPIQPNLEMLDCNEKRKPKKKKTANMKLKTEVQLAGLESENSIAATETVKEASADRDTNDNVYLDANDVLDAADQQAPDAQSLPVQPYLEMLDGNKKRKPKKKEKANKKLKTEVALAGLESGNSTATPETIKEAPADRDTTEDVNLYANDVPDAADQRAPDAVTSCSTQFGMLDGNKKRKHKKKKTNRKLKIEVVSNSNDAQAVYEEAT